ncbi:helix-turn-helix transcriptional regulator [Bradyrhizobium sp. GCM10027634]|uniref:helix-turn-helix transcriptional regulator n=1 Tax=unclassified Bradyrhizobium TaxID=2631580 RepID=UPI00188DB1DD|nr:MULTISPECIES: LuxR family transcriptional regulator [unclassified Bradyrhizobium]MDN5000382.1 LuxR C-terminal-related transcriptional regulator [Bradyrhizobium sp. WYCCWR 12677]QOZ42859.1 helix-turn-helix transcriptional regulator [Bradyrhizobium sp. CCBAU 53340]
MQQVSIEEFSDLIGDIYDCVIAPERWTDVLEGICARLGFATGALSAASLTNRKALVNAVSGSNLAEMAQNAIGYGPDIIELWGGAARIQQYPLGEPIVQSQAVRKDIIAGNRYYREWALPKGLFDAVAVGLVRDRAMVGNAIFSQHESAGPIDDAQLGGLRLLTPHIRRAVTISNLFDLKAVEAATFSATVEALTVGVVLADEDAKIVHSNAAATAMLAAEDPIVVRQGRIAVQSVKTTNSLQSAIAQAAKDEAALGQKGIGIPILRASGDPLVIHVLPLQRGRMRAGLIQRAAAALFVTSASGPPQMSHIALNQLYDLTPAEIRIFELICEGHTRDAISDLLGVSVATVKTHLLHVFEKTGSRRQVDLVRLAKSLTFPV